MIISRVRCKQFFVSIAIFLISVGVFFGLIRMKEAPEQGKISFTPPTVEIKTLMPEPIVLTIRSQGTVKPAIETQLISEVTGVVKEVSPLFVSGAVFKKNQVLAHIEDSDYKVALRQAEAVLATSKAQLAEELAKAEAEEKNWINAGKKLKDAPALLLRKPYVAETKASVQAAQAVLEKAHRDLDKTVIRAPYDGMIKERLINLGQFISSGKGVGSIFSVDYAEVRLPITPSDLEFIDLPLWGHSTADPKNIQLEKALGRRFFTWDAVIDRVEGIVDQQNRMHFVVAKVYDPYGLKTAREMPLKSGSFVQAKLEGKKIKDLFRLPRTAIYGSGQVLVLNRTHAGKETLHFRKVKIIYANELDVFVSGELSKGEEVCLTPLNNPIEGMQVNSNKPKAIIEDRQPVN